jgi:hypothetical protein
MDCYDFNFGLAGFGSTEKDAIADFFKSRDEEKIMCEKEGNTFPELEFEIQYDICSFLNYYSNILSKSGLEKITGINQKQLCHYSSVKRNPKKETAKKIQTSIYNFADELKEVHFVD